MGAGVGQELQNGRGEGKGYQEEDGSDHPGREEALDMAKKTCEADQPQKGTADGRSRIDRSGAEALACKKTDKEHR